MKTWIIFNTALELPILEIQASSFDEALQIAREIDKRYNGGKIKD